MPKSSTKSQATGGNGGSGGMSKAAGGPSESTPKRAASAVSSFALESSNSPKKGE